MINIPFFNRQQPAAKYNNNDIRFPKQMKTVNFEKHK